jgi:hypothetical protein
MMSKRIQAARRSSHTCTSNCRSSQHGYPDDANVNVTESIFILLDVFPYIVFLSFRHRCKSLKLLY